MTHLRCGARAASPKRLRISNDNREEEEIRNGGGDELSPSAHLLNS